jgi:hypothetical protein
VTGAHAGDQGKGPSRRLRLGLALFLASLAAPALAEEAPKEPAPVSAVSPDGRRRASASPDGTVSLIEVSTGRILTTLQSQVPVASLSFSGDGKRLTAKGTPGDERIWDIPMEILWQDLAGDAAAQAIRSLAASPETVTFLGTKLRPAADDAGRIAALIAQLDDDRYAAREEASQTLEALGPQAEPALRRILAETKSLEVRARSETLLAALKKPRAMPTGEALRTLRAIQLLELIGTPEARRLLETLASGAPGAPSTLDAGTALRRLDVRGVRK